MKNSFTLRHQAHKRKVLKKEAKEGENCERASRRVFNLMIYFVLSSGMSGWKEKNGERRDFFSSFYESRLIHEFHSDSSFAIYASRREFFSRRLAFLFFMRFARLFKDSYKTFRRGLVKDLLDFVQSSPHHHRRDRMRAETFEKSPRRRRVNRKWISGGT